MAKYDYLIVGAGLFGAVFAYEAGKRGKSCLVIDKRPHIAGMGVLFYRNCSYKGGRKVLLYINNLNTS